MDNIIFNRKWAMPNKDTFSVKPIGDFVKRYLEGTKYSVDPFARNNCWTTHRNDLNPNTLAQWHMEAEQFLIEMQREGTKFDVGIFDPPYSPRQLVECYGNIGKKATTKDTQIALMFKNVRNALDKVMVSNGIVLSFGWNSVGMGKKRNYELIEILLVCHGGGHSDTICIAEKKL